MLACPYSLPFCFWPFGVRFETCISMSKSHREPKKKRSKRSRNCTSWPKSGRKQSATRQTYGYASLLLYFLEYGTRKCVLSQATTALPNCFRFRTKSRWYNYEHESLHTAARSITRNVTNASHENQTYYYRNNVPCLCLCGNRNGTGRQQRRQHGLMQSSLRRSKAFGPRSGSSRLRLQEHPSRLRHQQ